MVMGAALVLSLGLESTGALAQTPPPPPSPPVSPPAAGAPASGQDEGPTTLGIPAGASGAVITAAKPSDAAPLPPSITPPKLIHFERAEYPKAAL